MKKFFLIGILLNLSLSCSQDDSSRNGCNNSILPPAQSGQFRLNLNAGANGDLKFCCNDTFIPANNFFLQGAYIKNNGPSGYTVFELAEPNSPLGSCSLPVLEGTDLVYTCGDTETRYDILNGLKRSDPNACPLRRYRTALSGDILLISF